jgi:hypothetical protein
MTKGPNIHQWSGLRVGQGVAGLHDFGFLVAEKDIIEQKKAILVC